MSTKNKVLIDIGHPAHVHYFKNAIKILSGEGVEFFITARDKDVTFSLLDSLGLNYFNRGKGSDSLLGKLAYTFVADFKLISCAKKFKPDLFLSFGSPYAAHASKYLGLKHIAFDDTENAKLSHLLYRPFTEVIYSPSSYKGKISKNQLVFNGYMELAYLHPNYFTPNPEILKKINVVEGEKFVIIRFVSWNANHDVGHAGLTLKHKIEVVNQLSKFGKVLITSEGELPEELKSYQINIEPIDLHHILAFASLLYGESATMASECAILGTPSIYHDNVGRGYTDELESKYKMVYNFSESEADQRLGLKKAVELLSNHDKGEFLLRREKILKENIDVTDFIIDKIKCHLLD